MVQFLKNFVSNLGYQNAPFGFDPYMANYGDNAAYNAGLQYISDIGGQMLANGDRNVLRSFGKATVAASDRAREKSKQGYVAKQMMEEAEERRKERQMQAEQQAMIEAEIAKLPPEQQGLARIDPRRFFGERINQEFATRGTPEFGLAPIALADENGEFVGYGQMSKAGGLFYRGQDVSETKLRPMDPNALAFEKSAGSAQGKISGVAAGEMPGAVNNAEYVKMKIDNVINDPALDSAIGWTSYLPNAVVPNKVINVRRKLAELEGEAFLQARTMLKGGGQITDFESKKAEAAYNAAQIAIQASDPQALKDALKEFKLAIDNGLKKLAAQSGQPVPEGVTSPSPKRLRFNPETGELE